ncbi:MAG: HAD family hydrolase [Coriobacteriales bacterium]|nr:HAD family hydrolase [Coriobacteriales bacterium]
MQAVLFDLDGTLLDIDMSEFLTRYFRALVPVIVEVAGCTPEIGLHALLQATDAMCLPHPGVTNRDSFADAFSTFLGRELDDQAWSRFDRFYVEDFPGLRGSIGPHAGARRAVEAALACEVSVAIATNPIFPEAAIAERIRWAGLDDLEVDLVTTYERMTACKPMPAYYLETANALGARPSACLMVGDDRELDMSAADVGMRTFYVGPEPVPASDWSGTLADVAALLPRLASHM